VLQWSLHKSVAVKMMVAVAVLVAVEMKKCDGDGARCLPARSVNGREWWPTVAMVMVDALDGR